MTKSEILAMQPGAELDALVAEKVMGEKREVRLCGETNTVTAYRPLADGLYNREDIKRYGWAAPYSADIAAAWRVVERLQSQFRGDIHIELFDGLWNVSTCYSEGDWRDWTLSESAPEAICKAALLAEWTESEATQ